MASEKAQLEEKFMEFVSSAASGKPKDPKLMSNQACAKLVRDTLPKGLETIVDASVFPLFKDKATRAMPIAVFPDFIRRVAWEYAKLKAPKAKVAEKDPVVDEYEQKFRASIIAGKPIVKEVKQSKTGAVSSLTDSSKYTGAHKSRFNEDGKGKGMEGREDLHDNTGYVGQYKGKDTYATKK